MQPKATTTAELSSTSGTTNSDELAQLRLTLAEQTEHLDELMARITYLVQRESELRAALLDAHQQLAERDRELQTQRAKAKNLEDERSQLRAAVDEAMILIELCDEVTREQQKKSKKKQA
jgi:predicted nuclease with TOPRIM domain